MGDSKFIQKQKCVTGKRYCTNVNRDKNLYIYFHQPIQLKKTTGATTTAIQPDTKER